MSNRYSQFRELKSLNRIYRPFRIPISPRPISLTGSTHSSVLQETKHSKRLKDISKKDKIKRIDMRPENTISDNFKIPNAMDLGKAKIGLPPILSQEMQVASGRRADEREEVHAPNM